MHTHLAKATTAGLLHCAGHAAHSLDDLEEDGGAVADGLGEDLQQDALVIFVDQHAHLLRHSVLLLGERTLSDASLHALVIPVVLVGHELETSSLACCFHFPEGRKYVICEECNVLHSLALQLQYMQ